MSFPKLFFSFCCAFYFLLYFNSTPLGDFLCFLNAFVRQISILCENFISMKLHFLQEIAFENEVHKIRSPSVPGLMGSSKMTSCIFMDVWDTSRRLPRSEKKILLKKSHYWRFAFLFSTLLWGFTLKNN